MGSWFECQQVHKTFRSYESVVHAGGIKISVKQTMCPSRVLSFYEDILVTKEQWIKICIESESQSECLQSHSERSKRITSSRRAHQIKTRNENFEKLADQCKNNKFQGRMNEAMAYGISSESIVRDAFVNLTGKIVNKIGLVIKIDQPFLAASPDGIILTEKALLEIKCPFSCKSKAVLDRETKISNVPYVQFDDNGNVELKRQDVYCTQVQVPMYVLGFDKCYFFVYSSKDSFLIAIKRHNSFFSESIPKIESFYFKFFLPALSRKDKHGYTS